MPCLFALFVRSDNLWICAAVGACGGLYLFYRGFRILQRKRLIANTPTSKVRSAALGLVEINGLAVGPYTLPAPITGRACFYYRTLAWELRKSGKNEEWQQVADESLHVPFYVDDNTGQQLINPQEAEMDLHRDFHEEYSNSMFFGKEMPESVRAFLARHAVSGEHRVRVDEYCIKPKNALFILGTLAENIGLKVSAQPIKTRHAAVAKFVLPSTNGGKVGVALESTPGSNIRSMRLRMTSGEAEEQPPQEVIQLSAQTTQQSASQLTQQGKIAAALIRAGIHNPNAWAAAGVNPALAGTGSAGGVLATDASSAAPGTALEQFDLQPKTVLMKGENNSAFFISWRSQREIVAALGWKSAACIWGGPALTLISVYLFLAHLGWL
jgi:E3 Ubiquitin ligase